MCYADPGPRCSGHAKTRLDHANVRLDTAKQGLKVAMDDFTETKAVVKANPEDMRAQRHVKTLYKNAMSKKSKYVALRTKRDRYQRDYDGTPSGQKILNDQLEAHENGTAPLNNVEFKAVRKRRVQGKMLYSWRKNQLDLKREQDTTGLSLKERRGKFLSLVNHEVEAA